MNNLIWTATVAILLLGCVRLSYEQGGQDRKQRLIQKLAVDAEKDADENKRKPSSGRQGKIHPASLARAAFTPTHRTSQLAAEAAEVFELTTNRALRSGLNMGDIRTLSQCCVPPGEREKKFDACGRPVEPNAPPHWCDRYEPYRSPHGWCNNRERGQEGFGSTFRPQGRVLPANYEDQTGTKPRHTCPDGRTPLPSARSVSVAVFQNLDRRVQLPNIFFQWGQYIAHDIVLTPINSGNPYGGGGLSCDQCDSDRSESAHCFPIPIQQPRCQQRPCPDRRRCLGGFGGSVGQPQGPLCEPLFRQGSCLPFVRSLNGQFGLGARAQQNQLTAYIDASALYSPNNPFQLREPGPTAGGRLKLQANGLLPPDHSNTACTGGLSKCFLAGDPRNSITMGLASVHTMWVHEHNRIVGELARLNPDWDNDQLYEEGRQIVGAMHQHITYSEYLPAMIGRQMMLKFKLFPYRNGFSRDYDSKCDAGVVTEFSTAAFRFGHSLINSQFRKGYGQGIGVWDLAGNFFNPSHLYEHPRENWRNILIGMQYQQCRAFDTNFDSVIQHQLFARTGDPLGGVDLPAMNIQRGRDHGLQFYTAYRRHYGLFVPTDWHQLSCCMSPKAIESLKRVYKSVDCIELYPGMMLEKPLGKALVGQLCAHILADQFSRLKRCDRFWYEYKDAPSSFPLEQRAHQLREIRKVTFHSVMCGIMNNVPEARQFCNRNTGGPRGGPRGGVRGNRRGQQGGPLNITPWKVGFNGGTGKGRRRVYRERFNPVCHGKP